MIIAVDNHVSFDAIDLLESQGHKVYNAFDEMDQDWFIDGLEIGAEIFISMDWDIGFLCNKHNKKFIILKQNLRGFEIGEFILKKINKNKFD